jgi:hypothetical protein
LAAPPLFFNQNAFQTANCVNIAGDLSHRLPTMKNLVFSLLLCACAAVAQDFDNYISISVEGNIVCEGRVLEHEVSLFTK